MSVIILGKYKRGKGRMMEFVISFEGWENFSSNNNDDRSNGSSYG